jgi:hypothetical protein
MIDGVYYAIGAGTPPEFILADHRILQTGLDIERSAADLDRFSGEDPDGNVSFVA